MQVKEVVFENEGNEENRPEGMGLDSTYLQHSPQGSEERFVQIEMATTALGSGSGSRDVSLAWG